MKFKVRISSPNSGLTRLKRKISDHVGVNNINGGATATGCCACCDPVALCAACCGQGPCSCGGRVIPNRLYGVFSESSGAPCAYGCVILNKSGTTWQGSATIGTCGFSVTVIIQCQTCNGGSGWVVDIYPSSCGPAQNVCATLVSCNPFTLTALFNTDCPEGGVIQLDISETSCDVSTVCCTGIPIPFTLYAVFTFTDCPCSISQVELNYNSSLDKWIGTLTMCTGSLTVEFYCDTISGNQWSIRMLDGCLGTDQYFFFASSYDCDLALFTFTSASGTLTGCGCTDFVSTFDIEVSG